MVGGLIGGIMASLPQKKRRNKNSNNKNSSSSNTDAKKKHNKAEQEFAFGAAAMKPPVPLHQSQQVRGWLEITPDGTSTSLMLSKMKQYATFQLPLRDLRILDPMLATSYPSALLAREKNIIVNMEFVKMVVGLERCYVTNLEDPNASNFVEYLQERLKGLGEAGVRDKEREFLPFELRVLETALDYVSKYLEQQVTDLEAATHPALDALTLKISTSNLERVRRIKNRMVRLNLRIETLKEVLEKTLDDDADMKDFNLSALEEERLEEVNRELQRFSSTPFDMPMVTASPGMQNMAINNPGYSSSSSSDTSLDSDEDVEVVEQLMESYFMRLDNTWNRWVLLTSSLSLPLSYADVRRSRMPLCGLLDLQDADVVRVCRRHGRLYQHRARQSSQPAHQVGYRADDVHDEHGLDHGNHKSLCHERSPVSQRGRGRQGPVLVVRSDRGVVCRRCGCAHDRRARLLQVAQAPDVLNCRYRTPCSD